MKRIDLEGGCYVVDAGDLKPLDRGDGWSESPVIDSASGATALSQAFVRIAPGASPTRSYPGSDTVLFALRGDAALDICGRRFALATGTGAFIRSGEAFRIEAPATRPIELLVTVCPECPDPRRLEALPDGFDAAHPVRTASASVSERHPLGDRFYQILVGEAIGSTSVTQFIGQIPLSKAPEHHHHYEEAIAILAGEGRMWTGARSAPVRPGNLIFLPMRQAHSLECTSPGGLILVGCFYPAGSPAVSYSS